MEREPPRRRPGRVAQRLARPESERILRYLERFGVATRQAILHEFWGRLGRGTGPGTRLIDAMVDAGWLEVRPLELAVRRGRPLLGYQLARAGARRIGVKPRPMIVGEEAALAAQRATVVQVRAAEGWEVAWPDTAFRHLKRFLRQAHERHSQRHHWQRLIDAWPESHAMKHAVLVRNDADGRVSELRILVLAYDDRRLRRHVRVLPFELNTSVPVAFEVVAVDRAGVERVRRWLKFWSRSRAALGASSRSRRIEFVVVDPVPGLRETPPGQGLAASNEARPVRPVEPRETSHGTNPSTKDATGDRSP